MVQLNFVANTIIGLLGEGSASVDLGFYADAHAAGCIAQSAGIALPTLSAQVELGRRRNLGRWLAFAGDAASALRQRSVGRLANSTIGFI